MLSWPLKSSTIRLDFKQTHFEEKNPKYDLKKINVKYTDFEHIRANSCKYQGLKRLELLPIFKLHPILQPGW